MRGRDFLLHYLMTDPTVYTGVRAGATFVQRGPRAAFHRWPLFMMVVHPNLVDCRAERLVLDPDLASEMSRLSPADGGQRRAVGDEYRLKAAPKELRKR